MSHENSITVKHGGKFVNIPTFIGGKQVSEDEAVKMLRDGKIKPLGGQLFNTIPEAVDAAKKRSGSFGKGK